jgi:hypothetical protein
MDSALGCKVVAHVRFRISGVKIPSRIEDLRLVDGHPQVLAKVLGPRRDHILQAKLARMLQAFIESAVKGTVTAADRLNLFHETPKLIATIVCNYVLDRDGDRSRVMWRDEREIVERAGPTIPDKLSCTPPKVIAEGSSSLSTISGTIAPHTGARKARPMPSAKNTGEHRIGIDHMRPRSESEEGRTSPLPKDRANDDHAPILRYRQRLPPVT